MGVLLLAGDAMSMLKAAVGLHQKLLLHTSTPLQGVNILQKREIVSGGGPQEGEEGEGGGRRGRGGRGRKKGWWQAT